LQPTVEQCGVRQSLATTLLMLLLRQDLKFIKSLIRYMEKYSLYGVDLGKLDPYLLVWSTICWLRNRLGVSRSTRTRRASL